MPPRVVFSQLALEHPHILLLDEPTNHLDMPSIDALAKAIKQFEGGVVIVSHDFRAFPSFYLELSLIFFSGLISQVAEELWEVGDKTIRNLTKSDIGIVDYKKNLIKASTSFPPLSFHYPVPKLTTPPGNAAIEKAKLFSKGSTKGAA